ncbi:isochorismatase family protein [Bowmanella pacifica]|uniref:Isochorismatase n=1 Tax=Bowmanella pacifica TaxID=502051 RepID=A0A917YWA0_9ALTE|nr:isochorismatase family protein [Bowmanella pacifica]GGO68740.1 isochorismatase [Bowmanella pacifica]
MPVRLSAQNCALLLIDVQGKLARMMPDATGLLARLAVLLQAADKLDIPILWLEQNPQGLGPTLPELTRYLGDRQPIVKYHFDACAEPGLCSHLSELNVEHLVVCGIEAHICVYQTCLGLLELGKQVHLLTDAIASRQDSARQLAVQRLAQEGAKLCNTDMVLFEWLGQAQHPQFKNLLPLIKAL